MKSRPVLIVKLNNCARCGGNHVMLSFKKLKHPAGDMTHWTPCPRNGQPILMQVFGSIIQEPVNVLAKRNKLTALTAFHHAARIVNDLSRGTKSEDRSIAIDEARDAILEEYRRFEKMSLME
jgi:hypothetical protein